MSAPALSYNPDDLLREKKRHYISASDTDIKAMLKSCGLSELSELFAHIPKSIRMKKTPAIEAEFSYEDLVQHVYEISSKNKLPKANFAAHGLYHAKVMDIVETICGLRELVTAYTPYQPERSQGTLATHWIYQSLMAQITGFEAINVSMYDRASTLFEACLTALRLHKKGTTCLLSAGLFEKDLEVLNTLAKETHITFKTVDLDSISGCCDFKKLKACIESSTDVAAFAFPQINKSGTIEQVDQITDYLASKQIKSIAVVDPILLGSKGLNPPANWGEKGSNIFVAEGQHLAIGPNFGGPGLGVFGVRFNDQCKTDIRTTPGRFVGKGFDLKGKPCLTQVISAREQHIRREKATSNICSNEAYISTIAGAAMLNRGEMGFIEAGYGAKEKAHFLAQTLCQLDGVELTYPNSSFFNEFTLTINQDIDALIEKAIAEELNIGVNVSAELSENKLNCLKISLSDKQTQDNIGHICAFFKTHFNEGSVATIPNIAEKSMRRGTLNLASYSTEELKTFYTKLASQNISPDNSIYPLGSCTMKYNPYINEYAAGLEGFAEIHPSAREADAQGSLQIIYETQEIFKNVLGLPAVTTQPVAGAQGEWMGLKMMQAYHRDNSSHERDIVLIPRSAHGTNPATATIAGFKTGRSRNESSGVVLIESNTSGQIDMAHFEQLLTEYGTRIAGVMITNPNTSGVFENQFEEISEKIHALDALVYMDGANLNAIAGWLDLGAMGVDAVHSNTHKTWSIPHGGGGPGDAFVAVSEKLAPYLPGVQVFKEENGYRCVKTEKSIGSCHRHYGNFAHKVRCFTYLKRLGAEGVPRMSALAVLCARYLKYRLKDHFEFMPSSSEAICMHEFIITLKPALFSKIEAAGVPKNAIIMRIGKLFLDFGFHAPTIAFPEVLGIMIEPTECYSKDELDRFADAVIAIHDLANEHPEVLLTAPHFTPIDRVDDVAANRKLVLCETIDNLPEVFENRISPLDLAKMPLEQITAQILAAHRGTETNN